MISSIRGFAGTGRLPGGLRAIIAGVGLLSVMLGVVGCGGGSASGGVASPSWITARLAGDSVIVPVNQVKQYGMTHFKLGRPGSEAVYMAYEFGGQIYVRPSICPPCRSQSFTLQKNILVCDACGTVFDARTGSGVQGACVNYPKAPVSYQVNDGNIVLKSNDLIAAYEETLERG